MTARFTGKVVLVTGGGSGLGRNTAVAFAREGATVVVAGRTPESLETTVKLIDADGGRATAVIADVTRNEHVATLVSTTVERHGGLHIAVNNAGIFGAAGPLSSLDEDIWRNVLSVNLTGVWLSMKHEIAHMRGHGGGVIINNASSIGAHARLPYMSAYVAAKAGVSALTGAAAREHIGDCIRINAVSPGPADTEMSRLPGENDDQRNARMKEAGLPIGRVATKNEISNAILWLASSESSYLVGHDLVVDGGQNA